MEPEYNHPPMGRVEKGLIWLVALCFCLSCWVHIILPGIKRLALWLVSP